MKTNINKNKLPFLLAIIWLFLAISFSEPVYQYIFEDLGQFFSFFILCTPVWLSFGWKWLINGKRFSILFWIVTIVINIIIVYILYVAGDDDYIYIPISYLAMFFLITLSCSKANIFCQQSIQSNSSKKRGEMNDEEKQQFLESNIQDAIILSDQLIESTADFIKKNLLPTGHNDVMAITGIPSEMSEWFLKQMGAHFSFMCSFYIFGKPFEDFSKSPAYEYMLSHFSKLDFNYKEDRVVEALGQKMDYFGTDEIVQLLKEVEKVKMKAKDEPLNMYRTNDKYAAFDFLCIVRRNHHLPNLSIDQSKVARAYFFCNESMTMLRQIFQGGEKYINGIDNFLKNIKKLS